MKDASDSQDVGVSGRAINVSAEYDCYEGRKYLRARKAQWIV